MSAAPQSTGRGSEIGADRRPRNLYAWIGPLVVLAGTVSYFVYFFRFPVLRDFPWVNLPLVALGLLISARGLRGLVVLCG